MNDIIKEYNGKNTYTNNVCHTLRLGRSWNLVTLNYRVGRGVKEEKSKKNIFREVVLLGRYSLGRRCPIGHPFKLEMEDFQNFHMP